jgi:hypothetical protein
MTRGLISNATATAAGYTILEDGHAYQFVNFRTISVSGYYTAAELACNNSQAILAPWNGPRFFSMISEFCRRYMMNGFGYYIWIGGRSLNPANLTSDWLMTDGRI